MLALNFELNAQSQDSQLPIFAAVLWRPLVHCRPLPCLCVRGSPSPVLALLEFLHSLDYGFATFLLWPVSSRALLLTPTFCPIFCPCMLDAMQAKTFKAPSPPRGPNSSPHHKGAIPQPGGGSCEGCRKIRSGPAELNLGPYKGMGLHEWKPRCVMEGLRN